MFKSIEDWKRSGNYFDFQGHQIFYTTNDNTEKPVLVLIHGFPTSSWDWEKLWQPLSEYFYLITFDMLGFGFSDKPRQRYSIFQQADILDALLEKLDVDRYHLLAHDYGNTVAQEVMARHHCTGKIQSMLFSNGGLFPETHRPVLIQKILISPLGFLAGWFTSYKAFKNNLDRICVGLLKEAEIQAYWQLVLYNKGQSVFHLLIRYMVERRENRSRWVGVLQETQVPMHLIDGMQDPISGAHMVARYEELIPNPSVTKLHDNAHYPHVENPERFLKAAFEFWDSLK